MGFLSSIWLLSIAAISIPVLIHLWNVRPGKTRKVGSIALIEASSRKRSRSFKLLDILLLLLRCLLLITVAVVLATPYLKRATARTTIGWLLIPKEDFKEAYQKFKPKADSLLKAGYEPHYFNDGFPKITVQQALGDTTTLSRDNIPAAYWDLLQQLNRQVQAPSQAYLITPGLLNNFSGERPAVSLKRNWQTYTPNDSVATSIQKVWLDPDKDVHVITETSQPSGTFSHNENLNQAAISSSSYAVNVSGGKATINLKDKTGVAVEIDTASLKIDIFAGANLQDAAYVKAALQTVGQFTQQNIEVKSYNKNDKAKRDWLFWLSDKRPDEEVLSHYKNVLVYADGKAVVVNSRINTGDKNIALYKSVVSDALSGQTKWQDGFGNSVLTVEAKGKTNLYHFYTHFNPAWNDLVWDANFPQLMQQLIMPTTEDRENLLTDKRVIDNKQILPNTSSTSTLRDSYQSTKDLTQYFWLFLVFLFLLERWLAHKKAEGAIG